MNILNHRLTSLCAGLFLGLPSASYADPVIPASEPLFLTGTVKHNVLLAIDDSGSMDFETLFSVNDGALWLGQNGSFLRDDGAFNDAGEPGVIAQNSGGKYTYIIPNGRSNSYDGRKLLGGHYEVPPIKPFAFARTGVFNRAYYDPNVQYDPWPSYGGFTFEDIDPEEAPFDIRRDTRPAINLTQNIDTAARGDNWGFTINDSDMPCTDSGGACGDTGVEHYDYFPAHYYVVQEEGTYTFTPSDSGSSFRASQSVLLEGEDAKSMDTGAYELASEDGSTILNSSLVTTASGENYAGVGDVTASLDSPPTGSQGQLDFDFTPKQTGDHVIWVRKYMPSGDADSLWINLYNVDSSNIDTTANAGNEEWVDVGGQDWNKWWQNLLSGDNWSWAEWGSVNFTSTANQTLRFRYREPNVFIDQVLVTPEGKTPSGPVELLNLTGGSITRDCSSDPSPSHYQEFFADTTQFEGVDAIGPGGECLRRVDIKSETASYSYVDENGNPQTRSYDDEITNFANWFTYYRRRHQAMRGGLASAFQGVGGIQTGLFWINERRNLSMFDMDDPDDLNSFLTEHYDYVSSGGTPNREALNHAGQQLQRTGDSAPIQFECQKNFTLLFTDGFSNDSNISGVGNEDADAGEPFADSYSSNLGDIAYKYYTENPRTDLTEGQVRVPTGCDEDNPSPLLDCNSNLHMNSYTVGLGASGTIFGQPYTNSDGEAAIYQSVVDAHDTPPTWPNTGLRDKRMIDDLYHAAVNGRGEMFNALTPADLRTELSAALRDIIQQLGNSSSVTFNTGTLNQDSLVFSASFNSTAWSGDLQARELDPATGDVAVAETWSAADRLDAQAPNDRVIVTYSDSTGGGVPFRWNTTELDAGQVADLSRSPTGADDGLGEQRLNFHRGARTGEGTVFRNRSSVLGDIIDSTPLFVGKPSLNWPDTGPFGVEDDRYSRFRNITATDRTPVIYVGANDGMLHGFNAQEDTAAGGGEEVLAYIPRLVYSDDEGEGLNYLTRPDYKHRHYVNLSPQAADVYTKATPTGSPSWRTVLIGGLRNGGVGLFALDVTDPDQFDESNADDIVLWEFSEEDDARLNYTLDEPTVAMMNNGRWAMIVGNGPANDSTEADESTGVFVIYMDGGLDGSWTEGDDYEYIEFAQTGGLSMVQPVDLDGDSVTDRVYGGDREGNIWVLDVSDASPTNWDSAFGDEPLFTATDGGGSPQPITVRPLVVRNTQSSVGSEGSNGEDYLVFFGTGSYFSQADASDTSEQSFYGVWDRGVSELDRDDLIEQTISEVTDNGRTLRQSSDAVVDWDAGGNNREYGWYMDLPETGERVINRAQIRQEIVFFETFTPSQNPCDGGGTGWLLSVELDGSNPDEPVFDVNNDGVIDGEDVGDDGRSYIGEKDSSLGTGGTAFLDDFQYLNKEIPEKREVDVGGEQDRTGRLGWQELLAP